MMDSAMTGGMVAWMVLWALITLGALVLIVLGILRLGRDRRADRRPEPAAPTAREILDRRYAAGEIDEDEYLAKASRLPQA